MENRIGEGWGKIRGVGVGDEIFARVVMKLSIQRFSRVMAAVDDREFARSRVMVFR